MAATTGDSWRDGVSTAQPRERVADECRMNQEECIVQAALQPDVLIRLWPVGTAVGC